MRMERRQDRRNDNDRMCLQWSRESATQVRAACGFSVSMADHQRSGRCTHYLPYRWVWDVRRNREASRGVGTLISGALSSELIETLSTVPLAFALYVTLKPIDKLLAQIAMYCRLGESFIGGVGMIVGFVRLRLYTSPQSIGALEADQSQALVDLTRNAGFAAYNISAIFFSIGSILFLYLFFKSRYIPRILSAFGVFASVVVTVICFASLIFPEYAATFQYGWAPMAIAEVTTGFWLMLFAVKTQARSDRQSARPAVIRA